MEHIIVHSTYQSTKHIGDRVHSTYHSTKYIRDRVHSTYGQLLHNNVSNTYTCQIDLNMTVKDIEDRSKYTITL